MFSDSHKVFFYFFFSLFLSIHTGSENQPTQLQRLVQLNAEILRVASLSIILSWERTIKALIRQRGCVGWSAPLMFACSYVGFSVDTVHKNDNVLDHQIMKLIRCHYNCQMLSHLD